MIERFNVHIYCRKYGGVGALLGRVRDFRYSARDEAFGI
ncbi:hypothetical protein F441_07505 [Phytophthora nicotianae CJ01A1]|uniref:Uncharacterized protein n=4 Tax=Phytophthora nicotianae TaxID=4792 RepID=V9FCD6_PHYNI|nr:hypothetical protein F443_07526 [Phytophthora nicotianae P1569]ETK88373.1 hypothetical protein L915_07347 [Phytophthora nicotianae]ETP18225.1 hypothetical protein F441_07505 [Phytophthora nicotianae CJ01A1]ETP46169.1 hypothetical protein F442_07535 [Phytophthora nicotianae P10297]ETL41789.1 hypothetical protein L916_07292 [Phytophthora nicotianae]